MEQSQPSILYDLCLALDRRLAAAIHKFPSPLEQVAGHVLSEIVLQRIVNSSSLIQTLGVEKTKISRIVTTFLENKWIQLQVSHSDKRVRYLTVTPAGRRLFELDNQARNRQTTECTLALSSRERKDLALLCQGVADGLGATAIPAQADDPACKVEFIRLLRIMGFLGDNVLKLDMPVDECQILHLVHRDGNCVSMATLKSLLPYESTTLSRIISSLVSRDFLQKQPLPFDKRHVQVLLTKKGILHAKRNISNGGKMLSAVPFLSNRANRDQLIVLLEKALLRETVPSPDSSNKIILTRISDGDTRTQARSFLIQTLVSQKRAHEIRESILHPDDIAFQILIDGELRGVCEFQLNGNEATALYFATSDEYVSKSDALRLFLTTFMTVLQEAKSESIRIVSYERLPTHIRDSAKALNKKGSSAISVSQQLRTLVT